MSVLDYRQVNSETEKGHARSLTHPPDHTIQGRDYSSSQIPNFSIKQSNTKLTKDVFLEAIYIFTYFSKILYFNPNPTPLATN